MNEYIEKYQPDKVYFIDFNQGVSQFVSMIIREKSISKTIHIRLTYIKPKDKIVGIRIAKYKGANESEKIDFSLTDYAAFIEILDFMSKIDYPKINSQKILIKSENDNGDLNETNIKDLVQIFKKDTNLTSLVNHLNKTDLSRILSKLFEDNTRVDSLVDLLNSGVVSSKDIVNLGYRKKQLEKFKELLQSQTAESCWQQFFEQNQWIFGYGLNYVFNSALEGQKMEQVTKGNDITGSGKRPDAFLASNGVINSVCLVEIKTNGTLLLKKLQKPYREECWQISDELAGAISQSQKTLQKTIDNLRTKFEPRSTNGDPTGESFYLYNPKAYLIIGNLTEFQTVNGINEQKFSSFQLYRRNIALPEIITFDELYERAKHIIEHSEII